MRNIQEIKKGMKSKNQDDWITFDEIDWLIEQVEKSNSQVSELVCAIYEHANEGTALMELAERIDSE